TRSILNRVIRVPAAAPAMPADPMAIQRNPTPAPLQLSRSAMSWPPNDQTAVLAAPISKDAKIRRQSTPLNEGRLLAFFVTLLELPGTLTAATNARPTAATAKPAKARRH